MTTNLYRVAKTNGRSGYVRATDAVAARILALAGEPTGVKVRKTTLVRTGA